MILKGSFHVTHSPEFAPLVGDVVILHKMRNMRNPFEYSGVVSGNAFCKRELASCVPSSKCLSPPYHLLGNYPPVKNRREDSGKVALSIISFSPLHPEPVEAVPSVVTINVIPFALTTLTGLPAEMGLSLDSVSARHNSPRTWT